MKTIFRILALALLAHMPALAHAWWNDDWAFRKSITIAPDTGVLSDAPPVLLRLHPIIFLLLRHATERCRYPLHRRRRPRHYATMSALDPANGMAFIWVQAPPAMAVGPTPGQIWMYYGNTAATSAAVSDGLHDQRHALVWHFGEEGAPRDASGRGNHAAVHSAEIERAALIGSGARFNGNALIQAPASDSLAVDAQRGWTFTAWLRIDAPQQAAPCCTQDGARALLLTVEGNAARAIHAGRDDGGSGCAGAEMTPGVWHQVALVVGGNGIALYLDAVERACSLPGPICVRRSRWARMPAAAAAWSARSTR